MTTPLDGAEALVQRQLDASARAALDVLAWLRAHAPEAIVPAEHRP